ncbi:GspE/PulE family protein [Tepidibacter thalassicus]|uniref:Type II secretion system protein E (GspE) n=1 Tax=Tepidibacter thalassicus DSM 15285 TaxID=1123350 RepID=A0A1M5T6R1_9FIRM|nr:ATPase, T2SS/T4P/T4SS family [Tepidibacter thalassicus]SHH46419.1 type II secretion system protein E (GspE) [Tepidibacter thalassicus DSM 15285]
MMKDKKLKLGELLVYAGKITEEQLKEALKEQKKYGKKLGQILVDKNIITEEEIIEVLEFQLGIPHVILDKLIIDAEIPLLITESLARRYTLIPIKKRNGKLVVAMADPLNIFAIDDVKISTGMDVDPVICSEREILNAIDQYYGKEIAEKAIEDFKKQYNVDNIHDLDEEILNDINNAPVVRLVNSIIKQAVKAKASDIHIEPFEDNVRIRFRIDGELQEVMTSAKSTHSAIVTRIKIMGKMNIAEKRLPQDGRIEMSIDRQDVDLRISVLPTVFGEKIVIRLLDRSSFLLSKGQLGFNSSNLERFDKLIKNPNGIILITGPTGSGKTTTLYTILRELNTVNKNIITVEDPVEYKLNGVNQVQVNNKAGLTFANGLRSILRQDPDIIMIGEIRDRETAEIAVRASITGHLVISTMHTNDAPSTITRLVDMGIEPYLISASVVGVVAQRLVRKICDKCKISYTPSEKEIKILGLKEGEVLYKGNGCVHCYNTGYKGRISIHEIMHINKNIRALIDKKESIDSLRKTSIDDGMITLRENCKGLVINGITTIDEFIRVTYTNV